MAIQNNFPNIQPTLNLSFALTKALDPRVSFARASAATYYGTDTAKAEENLLRFSQEFDNAGWAKTSCTVTANAEVAPDGTSTADAVRASTLTDVEKRVLQTFSSVSGQTYFFSVFIKAGNVGFASVLIADAGFKGIRAYVNLSTGAFGTVTEVNAPVFTTSSISSAGNDWYRVSVAITTSAAGNLNCRVNPNTADDVLTYAAGSTSTDEIFLWGAQLEQRDSATNYTPTTTQPITNYIPVLESAASGVARFDHNPTTFESLGLLIEESRTNLILRSEDFSTTWSMVGTASIVPDTVISPTGALTADKFVLGNTITSNSAAVIQSATKPAVSAPYTASVYIKEGGFNSLRLILRDAANASNFVQAFFNASTGVIAQAASAGGTFTAASATITPVGNGWYRCSVTGTTSTETSLNVRIFNYQNGTDLATGDGFSGIFIWGASLEQGAFPTSYIPTTTAQVTRAADAASMTGANFSSWYNQGEGTIVGECLEVGGVPVLFNASNGTTQNRITVNPRAPGVTSTPGAVLFNNVNQTAFSTFAFPEGFFKMALAYRYNDFSATINGEAPSEDFEGSIPVVNQADIGFATGFSGNNILIKKIAYYPKRLTNAELQGLTS